ncbi:PhzF family phenazine biosynthesis protein [Lutibacter citreus]|uniref:PhzF family phenazine biosynthesis protein n=1 Tax=Lutibacter citreus TaxID=2138210 RepID=UPI000DBE3501|nr:PhzF family phenazine biosynthesis protein [Lutibacter citreus]
MNIFQVDAFTSKIFKGNPAAVCPLEKWISTEIMQAIAEENNLSETVFFVQKKHQFEIKWFTPTCEIDLCGHATLAAAHIIFSELNYKEELIEFISNSGVLTVSKKDSWYTLNFPSEEIKKIETPKTLLKALNVLIINTYQGKWKLLVELEDEETIKNLAPNFSKLCELDSLGIIVTAKGNKVDFVSRFFAPKIGINEDPVTGSAHTLLIPFWAQKLKKNKLEASQLSKRTGFLKCKYLNNRVEMSGQAITFLKGKATI